METIVWELASLLREQYQRGYFISRPGQPTVAAITPSVDRYFATDDRIARYIENCLKGFLTPEKVDNELDKMHKQLVLNAGKKELTDLSDNIWEKPFDSKAEK